MGCRCSDKFDIFFSPLFDRYPIAACHTHALWILKCRSFTAHFFSRFIVCNDLILSEFKSQNAMNTHKMCACVCSYYLFIWFVVAQKSFIRQLNRNCLLWFEMEAAEKTDISYFFPPSHCLSICLITSPFFYSLCWKREKTLHPFEMKRARIELHILSQLHIRNKNIRFHSTGIGEQHRILAENWEEIA